MPSYAVVEVAPTKTGLFSGNVNSKKVTHTQYRRSSTKQKLNQNRQKLLIGPHAVVLDHFLNHSLSWAAIVCVLTIWALYIDDLRGLFFPKELDPMFAIINWIIFGIFLFEWVADSAVHQGYFGSLTSAMDLLAALSLVPMGEIMQDQTSVARIARTFRALRILRATRAAAMALKTEASMKRARVARKIAKDIEKGKQPTESHSKSLLEATLLERGNVKMLLGVLVLLMGMSLIDYTESDRAAEASLNMIDVHVNATFLTSADKLKLADQYRTNIEYNSEHIFTYRRLIYLKVHDQVWVPDAAAGDSAAAALPIVVSTRRKSEILQISTAHCLSYIDLKPYYDVMNINSMISTTFSIVVIMLWAMSFRRDYTVLVLKPVQRMVQVLNDLTKNPRLAIARGKMANYNTNAEDDRQKSEMEVIEACIGKMVCRP